MQERTLVSILIPTFNAGEFLNESIQSCLNQDYHNIELCIVNDGSTDGSFERAATKFNNYKNIKWFSFEKNKGKISALNKAYMLSTGEYIVTHAADDVMKIEKISVMVENIGDNALLMPDSDITDKNLKIQHKNVLRSYYGRRRYTVVLTAKNLLLDPRVLGGTIIRRCLAEKIFPLPIDLPHEDWWIPLKCSLHGRAVFLNQSLTLYRVHGNNTSEIANPLSDSVRKETWAFQRHKSYFSNVLKLGELSAYPIERRVIKMKYDLIDCFESKNICRVRVRLLFPSLQATIAVNKYYMRYLFICVINGWGDGSTIHRGVWNSVLKNLAYCLGLEFIRKYAKSAEKAFLDAKERYPFGYLLFLSDSRSKLLHYLLGR